jgi:hypothetical protein
MYGFKEIPGHDAAFQFGIATIGQEVETWSSALHRI